MSIKLVSWNVNGIRAVSKKDEFWDWFDNTDADIINFQEVRATQKDIPKKLANVDDFHQCFNEAERKGYSGVGTYSKIEPIDVVKGLGVEELDSEGRVLRIEYPDFILYNIYFPNSGMEAKRLDFKVAFCDALLKQLVELKEQGKNLIITGDYNIAHNPIDVYNPKNCEGKSGYLPEERAWLDQLEEAGFVKDVDWTQRLLERPDSLIPSGCLMKARITLPGGATEPAHVRGMPVGDLTIFM